jgi:hypothetical protein
MTTRILKHTLRGIKGWSDLNIRKIDVMKVVDITHRKRLFCIFNQGHPWSLTIEYDEPVEILVPIFMAGNLIGYMPSEESTQYITKRYRTERDVLTEINEIKRKQAAMINWQNKRTQKYWTKSKPFG